MRIVTVGRKTLKLWDSYDGEELCRYPTVDDVNVAVWSPDGTRVVAGTSLGAVLLLQVEDHRMIPAHVIRLGQRSDSLTNITGGTNASDESRIGVQLVSSGVFQKRGFYEEFESQGDPGPPAKRFTCKKCGAQTLMDYSEWKLGLYPASCENCGCDWQSPLATNGQYTHPPLLDPLRAGLPVVTAWVSNTGDKAIGCPLCRMWSEVDATSLGKETKCARCERKLKLNLFVISAEWRPIAKAWRGKVD